MYGGCCYLFISLRKDVWVKVELGILCSPSPLQLTGQTHFLILQQGRQDLSQKAHSQETSGASNDSEVMQKIFCLLKFPSFSCLFLFLNFLSIYNKYFFNPLLDRGLNPRARDEKEFWVKPCKYYAHSIRAQKWASWHSSANLSLTKAGEVFWKLSIRYINFIQSIHKINLRFKASLSLIEQIQTTTQLK